MLPRIRGSSIIPPDCHCPSEPYVPRPLASDKGQHPPCLQTKRKGTKASFSSLSSGSCCGERLLSLEEKERSAKGASLLLLLPHVSSAGAAQCLCPPSSSLYPF